MFFRGDAVVIGQRADVGFNLVGVHRFSCCKSDRTDQAHPQHGRTNQSKYQTKSVMPNGHIRYNSDCHIS